MQQEKLDKPCRVAGCPALASPKSQFDYCSIHNLIATDPDMYQKAGQGKLTAVLKEFAHWVEVGKYPKRNWG